MTGKSPQLDKARIRELFDLRLRDDVYLDDPYPAFHALRASGPVHPGVVHELVGFDGEAVFQGLPFAERPHFSAFSFEACDQAFRDENTFPPTFEDVGGETPNLERSMLNMKGARHRRYRGLVQPSFVPKKAAWWMQRWITETVDALIDGFEADGRADLNVDFDAAIPMLTITGSFGIDVADALDVRAAFSRNDAGAVDAAPTLWRVLMPIIAARRDTPEDDLISVLCQAESTDEEGTHRLSDNEILGFAFLLLAAGSGTTWKQLGITLTALLTHPETLERVRQDRALLRPAIEESIRWTSTDPMFSRFVSEDITFHGVDIPAGSVMHLCVGAASRDPPRWQEPDDYNIDRPPAPSLTFRGGAHVCLGMHVARAEMYTAINALLERLPNLRLDKDAEPPQIIGMYERGPTHIPVVWG